MRTALLERRRVAFGRWFAERPRERESEWGCEEEPERCLEEDGGTERLADGG